MVKKPGPKKTKEQKEDEEALETVVFDIEEYRIAKASSIWSFDDTGHDLTIDEQLFVRSYVIDRNPIAACRRIGFNYENSRLKTMSARYLANPEVQGAIETLARRMMEHLEITAEKVQRRLAEIAFFNPRGVVEFDDRGVEILNSRFWTDQQLSAVQVVEKGQFGVKVKFYDSLRAAEMLAKQLNLQPDESEANSAAAAKAGAEAVFDKIMDMFDKMVEPDEVAPQITYEQARSGKLN